MKTPPKKPSETMNGIPHTPFEEFALKKVEELVARLEKTKPKNSKVDVTVMEDSHHALCMGDMTAIMVHDIELANSPHNVYALYEYCPVCETAVRVL